MLRNKVNLIKQWGIDKQSCRTIIYQEEASNNNRRLDMSTEYLVKSRVLKLVGSLNCKISSQAIIIVNGRIEQLFKDAAERAKMNKRKTIMPQDIISAFQTFRMDTG